MKDINFAENLKRIRESRGISQTSLAKNLNISYQTYNGYETKGNEPKYDLLVKIAEKLCVSTDELLGVEQSSNDWFAVKEALDNIGFEVCMQNEKISLRLETTTDENAEKDIFTFLVGTFDKKEIFELVYTFDQRLQLYRIPMLGDFLSDHLIRDMHEEIENYSRSSSSSI